MINMPTTGHRIATTTLNKMFILQREYIKILFLNEQK